MVSPPPDADTSTDSAHSSDATVMSVPPLAKQVPTTRSVHGDDVVDPYAWLADRDDPDTMAYLEAENTYTASVMAGTTELQELLFDEIKNRIQETDLSVPAKKGPWWYYSRTVEGQQYPIHCRSPRPDQGDEQVLLDLNELVAGHDYLGMGTFDPSPDHRILAYSTNFDGSEEYALRFRDLESGVDLDDVIPGTYYGFAWAADNATCFYTTIDAAHRPYRLWRHRLGTQATDDVLVFEEPDERFFLDVGLTRSEAFVVMTLGSQVTTEVHVLPADDPTGAFTVIEPRRQDVEYHVEHHGDRFFILTNDGAEDFRIAQAPIATPGREHWTDFVAHKPGTRIDNLDAFADHMVVSFRRDALTGLRVIELASGDTHEIEFPEPVYTVHGGGNPEFATTSFRLRYTSLVTPGSVYDYDLVERTLELKKREPVLGGYDPDRYESSREWATASDGTKVPISLVRLRPDDDSRATYGSGDMAPAPCLLYGYGSYEISIDPSFSSSRLSLLDRGWVFAIAHIRGGGDLGRRWYEHGKLLHKRNTFTDFVACADHLIATGYTTARQLVARGGSAGGLLMGAVANLAPDRFRAIVAEVPFVDCLNTILDPSLPLTVTEWEEWGNPVDNADVYRYMKGYSPYENVEAKAYPAILAMAGLNDPRVLYFEPAKWVARLRATKTDTNPLLLKTEMGAGHAGPSGRYERWREEAFVLAFALTMVDGSVAMVSR